MTREQRIAHIRARIELAATVADIDGVELAADALGVRAELQGEINARRLEIRRRELRRMKKRK